MEPSSDESSETVPGGGATPKRPAVLNRQPKQRCPRGADNGSRSWLAVLGAGVVLGCSGGSPPTLSAPTLRFSPLNAGEEGRATAEATLVREMPDGTRYLELEFHLNLENATGADEPVDVWVTVRDPSEGGDEQYARLTGNDASAELSVVGDCLPDMPECLLTAEVEIEVESGREVLVELDARAYGVKHLANSCTGQERELGAAAEITLDLREL